MVSLINFKIVKEELQQQQLEKDAQAGTKTHIGPENSSGDNQESHQDTSGSAKATITDANNAHQIYVKISQASEDTASSSADTSSIQIQASDQTSQHGESQEVSSPSPSNQGDADGEPINSQSSQPDQDPTTVSTSSMSASTDETFGHQSGNHEHLHFSPSNFVITWRNLSYEIQPKWHERLLSSNPLSSFTRKKSQRSLTDALTIQTKSQQSKCVLNKLDGCFKSGELTAVLGPSGAGKTTLLNCLTGKLKKGVSGYINLAGANGKCLKMCTIPQKDHLLELLTVEENLWFASKIKNPQNGFDHTKNIERVIDLLGLSRCRTARIKKISGGQHKRVSIAQELLSNPDILVLDEPTSGLDSLTCFKTISMLRDLVELSANNENTFMKPMAIIVTIHQPQPKVFNLFHNVYILANGGHVIYEGPPTLSLETVTHITGLQPSDGSKVSPSSTAPASPTNLVDPASFLIEIASEEYGLEPIRILNDYQKRRMAAESPIPLSGGASPSKRFFRDRNLIPIEFGGGKDNRGFASDHNHDNKTDVYSNNNENHRAISWLTPKSGPKQRDNKRRTSVRSLDSGFSSEFGNQKALIMHQGSPVPSKGGRNHLEHTSQIPSSQVHNNFSSAASTASSDSTSIRGQARTGNNIQGGHHGFSGLFMSEQLLHTQEANHRGKFWSHTKTLTHRTLLTIRRDPLLMTSRVLFHLMIPLLMGHVYGKSTGQANACPNYEPEIDITRIPQLVEGKRIESMLEELHMSIENVSMFFIIMYAFAAAVLALNALSFPLNMQVLLKETRNGWYSMSSYVFAKTLADLPLELTMPCLTMALVYPLTGQPSSYMQWRMVTICLIMTLCSLIAQTQALILGALVMNSVQTAVFVSQASQLPWVILAGFTIRIKRLSEPLKVISLTSFYRLGCEAITLARYGFGICPCDPQEITGEPVRMVGIPDQLRTLAQYWIDSMQTANGTSGGSEDADDSGSSSVMTVAATTTIRPEGSPRSDIFQHLANQLSYANSYGVNITSCDDVAPDRIRAINLGDNWLVARIWHLVIMLIILKVMLYYAVKISIAIRL